MPTTYHATAALVRIDRQDGRSLTRQVEEGLRSAIVSRRLAPGTKLPSTRDLAEALGVSRNTVAYAFDELVSQGYLEARVGAGTFVVDLGEPALATEPDRHRSVPTPPARPLSERGSLLASTPVSRVRQVGPPRAFRPGVPAIDRFAVQVWQQTARRAWTRHTNVMLGYGDPAGYEPLRVAIANYLTSTRAVRATPDQIVVVSGSQQALDLAARVLADVDGRVLVEDPVRTGAWAALRSAGLRLVPVPVDAEGADIRAAGDSDAKLLYVSPSHQFPLGVRMSYRRRLDVLEWSSTTNGWVIEDDYDSEYRYAGQPLPSLQGMDATDSVVYIGTFSRSLFPSLRLGYLVAPRELTSAFVSARAIIDRQPPMLDQIVLAEFIEDGHFQRHLRRMRRIYGRRQEVLIESAQRRLGGVLEIEPDDAGMHVVGYLPDHVSDVQVESEAAALGVEVTALSRFSLAQRLRPGLLFGYAVAREDEIDRGVALLADAISTVAQP